MQKNCLMDRKEKCLVCINVFQINKYDIKYDKAANLLKTTTGCYVLILFVHGLS